MRIKNIHHDAINGKLFDKLIENISSFLGIKAPNVEIYSSHSIQNRLLQIFVELEWSTFKHLASHYENDEKKTILNENKIAFKYFNYHSKDGSISIKPYTFLKRTIRFIINWLKILLIAVRSLFVVKSQKHVCTLFYGLNAGLIKGKCDDSEFIRFCKNGPITPLNQADFLIIEHGVRSQSCDEHFIQYSKYPLYSLMLKNGISFYEFLVFFKCHLQIVFLYFYSIIRFPILSVLNDDFVYYPLVKNILNNLIDNIIITNSIVNSQPLWMTDITNRNYKLHMVWYSQSGAVEFIYKWDPVIQLCSHFRHIKVDENWLWTKTFRDKLRKLKTPGKFNCVGPILWSMPGRKLKSIQKYKEVFYISVFDVTPLNKKYNKMLGREKMYVYYSGHTMIKFVQDIIDAVKHIESDSNSLSIKILLKHKRGFKDCHSTEYINYIDRLLQAERMTLLPHDTNLFSLVDFSDLSIVIPYSSPALVSDYMSKPAIYYDPNEELVPEYEKSSNISFTSSKENLINEIKTLIKNKVENESNYDC
jgi:polysaccharide biosynthesis PFTS motif protein